jgi:hypothetical protein
MDRKCEHCGENSLFGPRTLRYCSPACADMADQESRARATRFYQVSRAYKVPVGALRAAWEAQMGFCAGCQDLIPVGRGIGRVPRMTPTRTVGLAVALVCPTCRPVVNRFSERHGYAPGMGLLNARAEAFRRAQKCSTATESVV